MAYRVLFAVVVTTGCGDDEERGDDPITWVQIGSDGVASARAITTAIRCPEIVLDSSTQPMQVRARPSADFPVLVCERTIPAATLSARIGGHRLALPVPAPERIVMIGDTGCRLKTGHPFQACNDPEAWPFAQIARSAAASQPQLVIDTGDYFYRELECPVDNAGCAGSPWGDNWATWQADFFTPAAPLLEAAPWIMVRGDHELCSRGGNGFFRFLDWRPLAPCDDYTQPWSVLVGDVNIIIMDSVDADDQDPDPEKVAAYAEQFATVDALATSNSWLVMHKPLWAVRPKSAHDGTVTLVDLNPTLQEASQNVLPATIERLIVGHIHAFEALGFLDRRAPSFVVGTGGTLLDPQPDASLDGHPIAGTTVTSSKVVSQFGFTILEHGASEWLTTLRDREGNAVTSCTTRDSEVDCAETP